MDDRLKPINYLKRYLGIKEGSSEHREILRVFNDSGLCPRYKMTTKDAWCAASVSSAFIASKLTDVFPCVECSCSAMISKAKKAGIWVENDKYIPHVGDLIMYDWQDSGVGDNVGTPDHVGIVESIGNGIIRVIEGNKSDTIAYRELEVNGRYIRGFITPKYRNATSNPVINRDPQWAGLVTASELNVRTWAGVENGTCSFSPLSRGTQVLVCDSKKASDGSTWFFIKCNGRYGFVHSSYIKRV